MFNSNKDAHIPVMLNEVLTYLALKSGGVYVDGTLGMGGHSEAILERIGSSGRLIALDRDAQSMALAKERLDCYKQHSTFVHDNFKNIETILKDIGVNYVDGILLDLGISSFQLDNPQRGFSFREDGPLDMRMDQESHVSAFDLVNSLSEKELSSILKDYGEERWHHRIARSLVTQRVLEPIRTTQELERIVVKSMPYGRKRTRIHPATRTFQAFRIAVNRELDSLEDGIKKCANCLKMNGRLVIISFHSLEDRIVKKTFKEWVKSGAFKELTKKPISPTEAETKNNPRARSARLRAVEKIL
ncbi:MAG: 16S rRNA (cytosine(1402)-N(4))-methyltransferase RsmH [Candidatus Omnitrophica bacterium]|nr:16S rRNA (cytosine(1402)-N(4))-methyltransferase RsmH [Candidatus Omnitrophota bacterium]